MLHISLHDSLAVSDEQTAAHFHGVAGDSGDPLDVIARRIERIDEYDYVAVARLMDSRQLRSESGDARSIYELVDEEKISLEQCVLHASAGDLERLEAESADDDEKRQ